MAWVNNAPSLLIPVPLKSAVVDLKPLPHSPLLLLASTTSLVVLETGSFLPLAYHNRSSECLSLHGNSTQLDVYQIAANTAENFQAKSAVFCVSTASGFVLIYQVSINYSNSTYEITDVSNPDNVLQNNLPLLQNNAKHSLTNIFKSATRTLGLNSETGLINIENFGNCSHDDDTRNENVPQVRITIAKLLKLSNPLRKFWTKPNSHSLVFHTTNDQIQIHVKNQVNHTLDLKKYDWFIDTLVLEYNSTHNFFIHVNFNLEMSVLELVHEENLLLRHTVIDTLTSEPTSIIFNPMHDLFLLQLPNSLSIYLFRWIAGQTPIVNHVKTLVQAAEHTISLCVWSPCGEFFILTNGDTYYYKMVSKFGFVLFDSASVGSEISSSNLDATIVSKLTDFCRTSLLTVSSNGQQLFLLNENKTILHSLCILRSIPAGLETPVLNDLNYISFPSQNRASHFHRIPLLPLFQSKLAKMQRINGVNTQCLSKRLSGYFSIGKNESQQMSLAYGPHIAISTPIGLGLEPKQALWYLFQNHFTDALNVIDHFWIEDFLFIINRYEKDDSNKSAEHIVDELMILSTSLSKYGQGGLDFKFDSDLIAWRHTFNNRIVNFEVAKAKNKMSYLLTLLTSDLKLVMMQIKIVCDNGPEKPSEIKLGKSRISINVCRTIHLSSIKHKFAITDVRKLVSVDERHFLFLLSTGEVYILKNQVVRSHTNQANNMYELKHVGSGIEELQFFDLKFKDHRSTFVSLFVGDALVIHDLNELVSESSELPIEGDQRTALTPTEISANGHESPRKQPIIIPVSSYMPLSIALSKTSIEVLNLEYQFVAKNEHLVFRHRTNRQLILNKFIGHDLFVMNLDVVTITQKYSDFTNYAYCLELLLYENLNEQAGDQQLTRICDLVNASSSSDAIYVNLLRKIEVHYWDRFFEFLQQTPVGLMDRLITLEDVELCYNYLIVYLNYKRESVTVDGDSEAVTVLNEKERAVISQIIQMLLSAEMWSESYELCRFIKLLEPLNGLLRQIQESVKV